MCHELKYTPGIDSTAPATPKTRWPPVTAPATTNETPVTAGMDNWLTDEDVT